MSQESRLVHIVDDVPELDAAREQGSRRWCWSSTGSSTRAAPPVWRSSTSSGWGRGGPVVATFDVDQFHDYRARRPAMSFVRDHYEAYDAPRLVVRLLHDSGGTPYLLLQGPEPDNRWEAFARAVREVVERFGVSRVVSMGAVPMAVPHTRPIAITHHANNPELITGDSPWRGELRIPSSAQALLELRLGEWGHDAMGFVAHIPHYLAQPDYPKASGALLENVERAGRLTIDLSAPPPRRRPGRRRSRGTSRPTRRSTTWSRRSSGSTTRSSGRRRPAAACSRPTSRCRPAKIGQQFEQFLAGLDRPDTDQP